MDKWDESVERVKHSILAEEPDAALTASLGMLADAGRSLDRIAENLELLASVTEERLEDARAAAAKRSSWRFW